jgi:uncharacterized coiled-coil DUF342 family protein
MISEFDLLSDKISKLVQLAQSLRQQNAELRQQNAELRQQIEALSADKASLTARINEAHDRVAAVLEQLPAPEPEVEQPEEPHDEEVA